MCGTANTISRGLGDVFTGGLGETNLGGGIFKKARNTVGSVLTAGTGNPGDATLFGPSGGATGAAPSGGTGGAGPSGIDPGASTSQLQQIFAPIATNANAAIDDNTATQLKQLRANQAARGVLQSGVSDIPTGDIQKGAALAKGNVQSGLANIFGNTEASRSLFGTQANFEKMMADLGYNHSVDLATQIANLNKPSALQSIFQGIQQVGPSAIALASLF